MSLLSEVTSIVGKSTYSVNTQSTLLSPQVTQLFPISSGQYKQVVGYCALGDSQYAPVINIETGEPVKLPLPFLPTYFFISAIKECAPTDDIAFGFNESATDFSNVYDVTDWYGSDINAKGLYGFGGTWVSTDFNQRPYLVLINYNYPTPTTSVVKVILQYITFQ